MAQSFPTSAEVIYNTLFGDAAFMAYVGSYTFNDGTVLPSISIKTPGEDLSAIKSTTGLEVVIMDSGNASSMSYVSNDLPDIMYTFNVFLVAWEPSNGQVIADAAAQMSKRFLGMQLIDTVAASDGLGALTQSKALIMSNMPIIPL